MFAIDGNFFFGVPINNKEETYDKIIEMDRNNDYIASNLLDYEHFSNNYDTIAIDLTKQIELEDANTMQQINFIGRLERNEAATMFSSFRKQKKQLLIFHKMLQVSDKMETQKIINLLNDSSNEESKFATKNGMASAFKQQEINASKTIL